MDFARERGGHGPGRMGLNEALQEIPLRAGQNFGEDTGIAYDVNSGLAAIQYNHYGPRAESIEEYLYMYDLGLGGLRAAARPDEPDEERCGFTFGAFLKHDAYARLQKFGIIHEIDFTIALPGVNPGDLQAGRSLAEILRAPLPEGAETLSMHIKAAPGRGGALGRDGAFGIIDQLRRLGGDVKRGFVRGKPSPGDKRFENVDLVEERLSTEASIELGRGRRYSRDDRWNALSGQLHTWLDDGSLHGGQP